MSEKNIYQKLVEVRKNIEKFSKDAEGYWYKYVSGSQVLSTIKKDLDCEEIILETHLTGATVAESKKGYLVSSPVKFIWVNAEKPEDKIEIQWFMTGEQKDPSQAFGSGLTYAERYFLLKFFGIPTDEDDPDKLITDNKEINKDNKDDGHKKLKDLLILAYTNDKSRKAFVDSFKGTEEEMIKVLKLRIDKELRTKWTK